ncbi:NAD-dependent epimerase/dehydratase family protein [uncultured Imperialibacter sp.]|uniref:NAD-dependent epimerase/dehydratase family protein n=1 Tax=uncultured Imperialibacter sp. TaxID=1672639 RepID=UPI0030D71677|tara:strand:- start:10727 stop:11395 length:669 start_codon:yes stop_codon:yes gene_type:complete
MGTKINVIVTGASGMVGEGVMHECLNHPDVEKVLVIGRKPCGTTHPKLTEIIHKDFFDLTPIADQLKGYNACYFCLGVSSVGMKEPEYKKLTYDLTLHAAELLARLNPDMTFCYVSGAATDSSEKGKSMWARVKGKTENDLLKLPFKAAYMFRPGYMQPTPGLSNTLKYYKYITWMYPFLKTVFPGSVSTLADLGQAMLGVTLKGYDKKVLEVRDIKAVAGL